MGTYFLFYYSLFYFILFLFYFIFFKMANVRKKPDLIMREAESKLKSPGFFAKLTGSNAHVEEAADLFEKASNGYKMAKNFEMAGEAACRAAECNLTLGNKFQAASHYTTAANCFKKCGNSQDAITYLVK